MINQDENLYFGDPESGQYGGMFVPEILVPALKQLKEAFEASLD
ncbi:MAG: tryptophan synthase subunit beta, partial [Gammaproteobacteria bacterium]